jgi:hypothetical protein
MENRNTDSDCYSLVSIAKLDSGICTKYKKSEHCHELKTIGQPLLASLLLDSIRLVTELFHCQVDPLETEIYDMANVFVVASNSLTITSKIVYLKNNTILTMYLNIQEANETATGYFWQFPVKTGINSIHIR